MSFIGSQRDTWTTSGSSRPGAGPLRAIRDGRTRRRAGDEARGGEHLERARSSRGSFFAV